MVHQRFIARLLSSSLSSSCAKSQLCAKAAREELITRETVIVGQSFLGATEKPTPTAHMAQRFRQPVVSNRVEGPKAESPAR